STKSYSNYSLLITPNGTQLVVLFFVENLIIAIIMCSLRKVGVLVCEPAPLEQNHRLSLAMGPSLAHPSKYCRLVGRLIYLCFIRLEFSDYMHTLSQFIQPPYTKH
ncbi:hypothetical protein CR513_01995, partial [Mucuna pruriens]